VLGEIGYANDEIDALIAANALIAPTAAG
jgi:hypothetical protein